MKKHSLDKKSFKILDEMFIYELDEPLAILSKILCHPNTLNTLMRIENRVIGLAYSNHNAAGHCLVIIMTDKIKENLENVMISQKPEYKKE